MKAQIIMSMFHDLLVNIYVLPLFTALTNLKQLFVHNIVRNKYL